MSPTAILNMLHRRGLIPDNQRDILVNIESRRLFSLHWELRSILYVGVLLLSSGLGLLIYENYEQIGHHTILAGIALLCAVSFWFAWRNCPPFTLAQTQSRSPFGDYALLLACLLFLALEGYAQYEYNVFGQRYGLVTILPALLFLGLAYRFDHRGTLGMGLTALVSWVGVTVRPLDLYIKTNFFSEPVVLSALLLSALLIGIALLLDRQRVKPHFTYTYLLLAGNVLFIALLGGLFNFETWWLYAIGLAVACWLFDRYARRELSFLFALMAGGYGYVGFTYIILRYLTFDDPSAWFFYFVISGIGIVLYFISLRKKLTRNIQSERAKE